jgi:hypothetical protein
MCACTRHACMDASLADTRHACPVAALESADNDTIQYVSHRQSKEYYDDGRRRNLFYLTDQHDTEHLAVVGEERETRDGHYTYSTVPPFNTIKPLQCYNQTGVYHWLEGMLNHHLPRGAHTCARLLAALLMPHGAVPRCCSSRRVIRFAMWPLLLLVMSVLGLDCISSCACILTSCGSYQVL